MAANGGVAGGGGGAGGGGLGGALFVQEGGSLTIAGAFNVNGSSVAGGAGGAGGPGLGGVDNGAAGGGGSAFGTGIFLQGNGIINFLPGSGATQTISDGIADQTGSGGAGVNAGIWGLNKNGAGTLVLSGANTYSGATTVGGGSLRAGHAAAFGTSNLFTVSGGATLDLNGFNQTFAGLQGAGTVTGANGTISGIFTPGNGTPGSSMAMTGNLVFQAAAQYLVQVNPTTSSFVAVTGTATLGGATVGATFAPGVYVQKKYTILTATGGVSGTFSGLTTSNAPATSTTSLSYDANNVYLNLALFSGPNFPGGLNVNQQNVANGLINFFNATGGIPAVFANLSPNGLSQAAGQTATGSQQATFNAMNQFMGVMMDPFIAGRGDAATAGGNASGFADEEALAYAAKKRNPNDALAAIYTKAPPMVPFQQRWSVWAAGFGGSQTTDGNTVAGSNTATSRIYGTAIGADYRFSPFTIAGFSLAGGGTNFSVANNGNGRSDLFQAGAFIRHNVGAAYLSGALAYGWQDVTTDRTVTIAGIDQLRARFNANAWSGRVEGGYRFVAPVIGGIGFTPYAAGQFTTFELPAYAEGVISGTNTFALAYGAKSVTDTRSELGLRTDKSFAMQAAILTLRGRLAWAHDFNPDRGIGATFQTLPGASFFVNGAAQAANSALVTASAETKWMNGWSTAATFEGEFSNVTRSYAGKGVVRYAW
ncbi:autotransporter domain-containing protein [Bradyrhizobium sp. AUGA SZCCT0160]|nr:autotransporter domain-containing protein [Bradyrhizobium sp. AUGA SZCCT0160]